MLHGLLALSLDTKPFVQTIPDDSAVWLSSGFLFLFTRARMPFCFMYRVVVDSEIRSDWSSLLSTLRAAFTDHCKALLSQRESC